MLLRLSAASAREGGDPAHPHVRLPAAGAWSRSELHRVAGHVQSGACVHVTLTIPRRGLPAFAPGRSAARAADDVRDRVAALARVVGPDASRVLVRFEQQPGAWTRWWQARAWPRGNGGAGNPPQRERRLDELLAQPEPYLDEPYLGETGACAGRPHVLAAAAEPLEWDVIDELHRWVSVGSEAHLVLMVPDSPVRRDPDLHLLWERRMALDVADREGELAQLWPGTPLVRIEVVRTTPTTVRLRRARRLIRWTP